MRILYNLPQKLKKLRIRYYFTASLQQQTSKQNWPKCLMGVLGRRLAVLPLAATPYVPDVEVFHIFSPILNNTNLLHLYMMKKNLKNVSGRRKIKPNVGKIKVQLPCLKLGNLRGSSSHWNKNKLHRKVGSIFSFQSKTNGIKLKIKFRFFSLTEMKIF